MKVIKIPYDRKIPVSIHDVADPGSCACLDEIKELIGIDWAEIVVLVQYKPDVKTRNYCLIVDEIGKLKEDWQDRINYRASQFYPGSIYGDPIVGDVVLCARQWTLPYGECDLAGLTDGELFWWGSKLGLFKKE